MPLRRMRIEILQNNIFQLPTGHAVPPAKRYGGDRCSKHAINETNAIARLVVKAFVAALLHAASLIKVVASDLRMCGLDCTQQRQDHYQRSHGIPPPNTDCVHLRADVARAQAPLLETLKESQFGCLFAQYHFYLASVEPCLDNRNYGYRLHKRQERNCDRQPQHPASVAVTAGAQLFYRDPQPTHGLDRRTLALEVVPCDPGDLVVWKFRPWVCHLL